eukprot:CAMPEP_0168342490 /NCGR_PEP_ID=MMETSP0213-20121227/15425_1 /TAXON_ID=151035 /ORGANISM="Euplotes harpa, Strain FSP1.4" /LENGTH=264 /DNA_ID=CAMNT_0008349397 /DNA_START=13 /DNA_END=807 /DNA_ORIENTATION=-
MDIDAFHEAFYEPQEFEEVEGGKYDDNGFYRLPGGDFYDPDGVYFDKDGKDKYGGYYDKEFLYHPGKEYLAMVKAIQDEHQFLEQFGVNDGGEEEDGLEEYEEAKQFEDDQGWEEYFQKERINPTLAYIKENPSKRFVLISFKGMSSDPEDMAEYKEWFKVRGVKPMDIAINASRINIRVKTDDIESIINAIKLEGTPDVDVIKVYLPFLSTEKVGIEDHDEDDEGKAPEGDNTPAPEGDNTPAPEDQPQALEENEDGFEISES